MCPLYGVCPLFRGFCFKFKFIDRDTLRTIALAVSHFLKRSTNKAVVEVIGATVNRGAGYGMEIPCKYRFYGTQDYIDRLRELIVP